MGVMLLGRQSDYRPAGPVVEFSEDCEKNTPGDRLSTSPPGWAKGPIWDLGAWEVLLVPRW